VAFERGAGSAEFDEGPEDSEGCTVAGEGPAVCKLESPLDSIVLAGLGANDELKTVGFPPGVSVMLLGGEGSDRLVGGSNTEDVLVDGPGTSSDTLEALGRDDALMHNGGSDERFGGEGNDLFLSVSICDGDLLDGGNGRDNSSWTRLTQPVQANLALGEAGSPGTGEAPECGNGQIDRLVGIEDLEGTLEEPDVLYGDAGPNQLLGWRGADSFYAQAGNDSILANSGDADKVIDCGEGEDSAQIDISLDPTPIGCETVNGVSQTLEEELLPPPPPPDVVPPRTRITAHPPKRRLTRRRLVRVAFRFTANEAGSRFRCKLDRGTYAACRSPRTYRVGRGGHVFRVFAIDPAGNRDASPAVFRFRVKRISGR
jgi:hypothetical protein